METSSNNGGQMNFETDLASLGEFIKKLQTFSSQVGVTDPDIKRLTKSFNELNKMITTLNNSFSGLHNMSEMSSQFNEMIKLIQKMQSGMSKLTVGNEGLKNLTKDIRTLQSTMEGMTGVATQFNTVMEQVGNSPAVSVKELNTFFKQLEKTINLTSNSFRSLVTVSDNLDQISAHIDNLVKMFDSLTVLAGRFNELMQTSTMPADASKTEAYFKELFVLIERMTIMLEGLSTSSGGLSALAVGLQSIGGVVASLTGLMEHFNTLLQKDTAIPASSNLIPYFQDLMTLVARVDQEFRSIVGSAGNVSEVATNFATLNGIMSNLVSTASAVDTLIQRTATAPESGGIVEYFRNLITMLNDLELELSQAATSFQSLKSVTGIFREIRASMQEISKLSVKFGNPEDVQNMERQYMALLDLIKKLVTEINSMEVDTKKFTQLNEVLEKLNQTITLMNSQMKANVAQQQTFGAGMQKMQTQASGFSAIFAGAFGPRSTSLLGNMFNNVTRLTFGFQALVAVFGGRELWQFLIGYNQQIEVLQTSLEVTLKSARAAEDAIRSLRSYAALTPFVELETFKSGEMLAANRMDIDRWIRIAGDLASAKRTAGVQLEDVVNVLTRINSGDFGKAMIRLRQMGISINDLREKGLEFTKNNTFKGSTDEFLGAIEQIVEERYGGLTEALGNTTEGLISTVKDFFQQLGIELGEGTFGDLENWLRNVKSDLLSLLDPTSQAGKNFEEFVQKFNEFMQSMEQFFKPFVTVLTTTGSALLDMLPLIGKLLQLMITLKIVSAGLTMFSNVAGNLSNMGKNWVTINALIEAQVLEINAANLAISAENRSLTQTEITLAKINALRKAGNVLLTEEQMRTQLNGELTAMTAASVARNTASQAAGGAVGAGAAGLAGLSATLATKIPMVLAVVAGVQLLGMAVQGLVGMFKKESDALKVTSNDYDRVIGQRIEEVSAIETLEASRQNAIETINVYSGVLKDVAKDTDHIKYSEEQAAKYTNELMDAKNQLTRVNKQLITTDAELADKLTDNVGRLNDETAAYELSTKAIEANILARKGVISKMYQEQLETAKAEKSMLEKEIEDSKAIEAGTKANKVGSWAYKITSGITGLFGIDLDSLMPTKWAENYVKGMRIGTQSQADREQALSQQKVANYEKQTKIQSLKDILNESETARKEGYFVRDSKGNIQYSNGKAEIDIGKYRDAKKREQERNKLLAERLEASALTFQNIVDESDEGLNRIKTQYEIKLSDILLKNGNNTDDSVYKAMQQEEVNAYSSYIDGLLEDMKMVYENAKAGKEEELSRVSKGLKILADAKENFTPDYIVAAINYFRDTNGKIMAGMEQYAEAVKLLNKDLKGAPATNIKAILNDYDTFKEAKKAYESSRDKLELQKKKEQLTLLDKSSSSSRSAFDKFNDQWEKEKQQLEVTKDIVLQRDELAGIQKDSGRYIADQKAQNQNIVNYIYREMAALRQLMNSDAFKKSKDYEQDKYQAQLQLLQLEKEANSLLLDIKNNTSKVGEFNKPGFVRAMTYYDYKAKDATSQTIEFSDAQFVLQVSAPQTLDDIDTMWQLIKSSFTEYIQKNESAGVRNNYLYR